MHSSYGQNFSDNYFRYRIINRRRNASPSTEEGEWRYYPLTYWLPQAHGIGSSISLQLQAEAYRISRAAAREWLQACIECCQRSDLKTSCTRSPEIQIEMRHRYIPRIEAQKKRPVRRKSLSQSKKKKKLISATPISEKHAFRNFKYSGNRQGISPKRGFLC